MSKPTCNKFNENGDRHAEWVTSSIWFSGRVRIWLGMPIWHRTSIVASSHHYSLKQWTPKTRFTGFVFFFCNSLALWNARALLLCERPSARITWPQKPSDEQIWNPKTKMNSHSHARCTPCETRLCVKNSKGTRVGVLLQYQLQVVSDGSWTSIVTKMVHESR